VKQDLPLTMARRLLAPGPVVLVSAAWRGHANIMTAAWAFPLSMEPPLVAVAVSPLRLTHDVIAASEEFALNIPGVKLREKVHFCGMTSGRERDKWREARLTPLPAKRIEAPLVEECLAHIECGVEQAIAVGDHTLFVGRVLAVQAEEGCFDEMWLLEEDEAKPLHHLGLDRYAVLGGRTPPILPAEQGGEEEEED